MTKISNRKRTGVGGLRPTPELATAQPQPTPEAVTVAFNKFSVLNVVFHEVPRVPLADGEPIPQAYGMQLNLTAAVGINENIAEVRIAANVTPDPKVKPYNIHVEVIGVFSTKNGTPEQLGEFCRQVGPTILFPYIRELVHKTTQDGRYGEVRLNPMNVQQELNKNPWGVVEPESISSSIAPEQQSGQSDDSPTPSGGQL